MSAAAERFLSWEPLVQGIAFWSEPKLEPDGWGAAQLRTTQGTVAHPGVLLQLLDEERATWDGTRLTVPHDAVAELSEAQLAGLGLPSMCPYTLLAESGAFSITEPEFRFQARFRDSQGHRMDLAARTGCVGTFGGAQFTLHEPQFSVIDAIDTFNAATPSAGESSVGTDFVNVRLNQIARLHSILDTEDGATSVGADQYLREFRVVVPAQFTLALSRAGGEIVIDPELLVAESSNVPGAPANDLAVPAARQREFAERFRRIDKVRGTYLLGGGWFVALPVPVRTALAVVKEIQRSDEATRARFARQPRQYLKARLAGQLPDDELESVFFDGDYGARVSGIGLWTPKVLPWLQPRTQSWLPIEECGLTVGDIQLSVPPGKIVEVRQAVEDAIRDGKDDVWIDGRSVPASTDTLDALDTLTTAVTAANPGAPLEEAANPVWAGPKVVLLIKDNLEEQTYSAKAVARPGLGGTPRTLLSSLLPHQQSALKWLQDHWLRGTTGALLADDMGLGKTFETLAFVCWLREQMADGLWARTPVLIVAPTGLLENWRAEMAKHVASDALGTVMLCWGPGLARVRRSDGHETRDGVPVLDTQALAAADVVLTTYETLRDYQHSFCLVPWSIAIFDEAQKIKNPQTLATSAAKAVANKATLAIALTGTPVENRLSDLWCIVDAVQPLRLGSLKEFVQRYEGQGESVVQARRTLRNQLVTEATDAPMLMLRRLKKDHLPGLPRLSVHRFEELMPAPQAEAYARAVQRARAAGGEGGTMLKALHEMRTVSLHPALASAENADEFINSSARVRRMVSVLDSIRDRDEKALVFVEFKAVQAILIELLQDRYSMASAPLVINGEVPGDRRKRRVEEFQGRGGFDVMLLSPRAGGVGLTLTAANHVVHLARWWNPAVEDQCTDRVNRIGQTKDVHVYLPLARHPTFGDQSFDLLLDSLLERKRGHSEEALSPADMSADDVNELFSRAVA